MHRMVIQVILISVSILSYSQVTSQKVETNQKRIALLIGNGNYNSGFLLNPENDARAMKNALLQLGFDVLEYENLNQIQMKKAIDDFGIKLKSYDVGLFFYAGHGIQSRGINYLIPVDAELVTETQVEYDCVQADRVVSFMEESGAKVKIIILDACRNNPFERSWTRTSTGRGLATMNAPSGTLIAYATSPGSTASDGSGSNGLYTSAILEQIIKPDFNILQMFQNVRATVSDRSNKQQIPWESTSLIGDFYFNPAGTVVSNTNEIIKNESLKKEQEIPNEVAPRTVISDEYLIRNTISNIRIVNVLKIPKVDYENKIDTIFTATLNQGRNKGIKKGAVIQVFDSKKNVDQLNNATGRDSIKRVGTIYIKSSRINSSEGMFIMNNSAQTNYENYNQFYCKPKKLFNTIYGKGTVNLKTPHDRWSDAKGKTVGIGLGYMIYKNMGGYIEIEDGANYYYSGESIPAISFGIVKEIKGSSLIKMGLKKTEILDTHKSISFLTFCIGGATRIRHLSIIYEGYIHSDGRFYGVSSGLGYNF